MNSKFELLNEMVKCHKKILDILENDQRYRAENVMSPSEIVNIETKQEQVQESQTKEMVKSHKKMLDILENDRQKHQTTIALESSQIVNNQLNQVQKPQSIKKNACERKTTSIACKSKQLLKSEDFESSDIEDQSRNRTKRKLQTYETDSEARKKKRESNSDKNDDRFEIVETGRCFLPLSCDNDGNWHKTEEAKRGMYSILNRFETKEAPNGSSSYNFKGQLIFDEYKNKLVQYFVCYASNPYRRNCPARIKLEYNENTRIYELSRCDKHNHEFDCQLRGKLYKSQFNKSMPPKIEILSSKLDSIFDRSFESNQPKIKQEKIDY